MKLLFDQNLSFRLCRHLAPLFPGSNQVRLLNLDTADDLLVWEYARDNDFVIVTKDRDFDGLSAMRRHPPKVIRLRCGNQSTAFVAALLRRNHLAIANFLNDANIGYLEIG